jgi:hypothetical protein
VAGLAVDQRTLRPGETVTGQLTGSVGPLRVELVRVEKTPLALWQYPVARNESRADGSFTLVVPEDAPPTVAGRRCSLGWAVRLDRQTRVEIEVVA